MTYAKLKEKFVSFVKFMKEEFASLMKFMKQEKLFPPFRTRGRLFAGFAGFVLFVVIVGGIVVTAVDPSTNQGGKPHAENHPNDKVNKNFNPDYTMLLYMEVTSDMTLNVHQLQFPVFRVLKNGKLENSWETNKTIVEYYINELNNGWTIPYDPTLMVAKAGFNGFKFNQPHHFVIYIKNPNIKFYREYPILFGKLLLEKNYCPENPNRANKNRSFFGAKVESISTLGTADVSDQVLYVKNFYQYRKHRRYYPIGDKCKIYSLNINTLVTVDGTTRQVPVIFDPDTGNMGGGDPPKEQEPEGK
ncbi:MAG TPA: hypothetical protein VFP12_12185 [Allosphingosinicella sp.]|nr:hypothetical protein [Allosphingosinicella sp.]